MWLQEWGDSKSPDWIRLLSFLASSSSSSSLTLTLLFSQTLLIPDRLLSFNFTPICLLLLSLPHALLMWSCYILIYLFVVSWAGLWSDSTGEDTRLQPRDTAALLSLVFTNTQIFRRQHTLRASFTPAQICKHEDAQEKSAAGGLKRRHVTSDDTNQQQWTRRQISWCQKNVAYRKITTNRTRTTQLVSLFTHYCKFCTKTKIIFCM